MKTGQLTIDTLTLQETNVVQDSTGDDTRALRIAGLETTCDLATVEALRENLLGLAHRPVPISFEYKSSYNGYYRITDVSAETNKWFNGSTAVVWQMSLTRIGPVNTVDIESRLTNITRANDFSLTAERWHAPAREHLIYYTGATVGTPLTRTTDSGAMTVYRAIPAGVNPRWGATLSGFITGRVKFLSGGIEIVSARQLLINTGWELNNGLIRVRPATASDTTLAIAFYDGTAWRERNWDLLVAGSTVTPGSHFVAIHVTRRDHEAASVRIYASQPSNGNRVIIDLILRRGSRILEGQMQRTNSGDLAVTQDVADTVTNNTSYVISSSADANGLKMVVGSARSYTAHSDGGIQKSSTTFLDFWIGAEIGTPASGDAATDLRNQYIGVMPETTEVIRR